MSGDRPYVSAIVPCRDEASFIEACLESLAANDYPSHRWEILVVDGMSDDGTREKIAGLMARDARIQRLDNPRGIIPAAMNIGVAEARGEIILKIDAHARYPSDYVSRCVALLQESGADNVGGVLVTEPTVDTAVARAIAAVLAHPFGSGNSQFRVGVTTPVEADTAAFGCYRRSVFDRIGFYDEHLVRSSDMDLNARLRHAGGRIVISPAIVAWYYPRTTLGDFAVRNFVDGYWALYPWRWGSRLARPRHLAPLAALILFALGVASAFRVAGARWPIAFLVLAYLSLCLVASLQIAIRERRPGLAFVLPLVFLVRHAGYACGSLVGALRAVASQEFRARLWRSPQAAVSKTP